MDSGVNPGQVVHVTLGVREGAGGRSTSVSVAPDETRRLELAGFQFIVDGYIYNADGREYPAVSVNVERRDPA